MPRKVKNSTPTTKTKFWPASTVYKSAAVVGGGCAAIWPVRNGLVGPIVGMVAPWIASKAIQEDSTHAGAVQVPTRCSVVLMYTVIVDEDSNALPKRALVCPRHMPDCVLKDV